MRSKYLERFCNGDPIFPWFLSHFRNKFLQPSGACLIKTKWIILGFNVDFQLSFTIEGEVLIVKCVHTNSNRPNITGFARKSVFGLELMFRTSKSRRSRGEEGYIVCVVPNCGIVDEFDFLQFVWGFCAKYIVDFDIPIGDIMIMQVLHSRA